MLKNIYKKLGIESDLEREKARFINKVVNQLMYFNFDVEIIYKISTTLGKEFIPYPNKKLEELLFTKPQPKISFALSTIFDGTIEHEEKINNTLKNERIKKIISYDLNFEELLAVIEVILDESYFNQEQYIKLFNIFKQAFSESVIDLGYGIRTYKNKPAIIYKKGVSFLDEKVVFDVLDWLENYPKAKANYSDALKFFFQKDYANSLTNSYSALEAVAKQVLNAEARLDKPETRNKFTEKLGLDRSWGKIFSNFSEISHEFSTRHGGNNSTNCNEEQAEFYLYQTGTYLRLISKIIS